MSEEPAKPKLSLLFNKKRTKGEKRDATEVEDPPAKIVDVEEGFGMNDVCVVVTI